MPEVVPKTVWFFATSDNERLVTKKIVAQTVVARTRKLPEPDEPNTVCEAPEPKEAPASAPLPC